MFKELDGVDCTSKLLGVLKDNEMLEVPEHQTKLGLPVYMSPNGGGIGYRTSPVGVNYMYSSALR